MNEGVRGISRRRFLQGMSGTVGGLGLAACEIVAYPPATPKPVERVTVVPVPTRRPFLMPVEVELMIGSISDRNSQAFKESMKVFHSYYPGIRIWLDVAKQGHSQRSRILTRYAAGLWIDVAQFTGSPLNYVDQLIFSNLHGFVRRDNSFNIEAYYSRIVDYYNMPYDGLWCLPWSYATEALYYNKQHFAEAGISTPNVNWTWEDVRDTARTLTKGSDSDSEPESWGVEFRLQNIDYVLRSFGGGFPIEEVENPEEIRAGSVAAMEFVADLVLEDGVHPFPRLGLNDGFAQGKVSMSFLPEWATPRLNTVEGLDYDVAPVPQGPAGSVTSFFASGVAMGTECRHPDHSWEVVKWFAHADFGEWDVARALLFPEGDANRPASLRMSTAGLGIMKDRRTGAFFSKTLKPLWFPSQTVQWWPHLSEYGWFSNRSNWRNIESVFGGSASVEEVVEDLEESWNSERTELAEVLSWVVSDDWGCS